MSTRQPAGDPLLAPAAAGEGTVDGRTETALHPETLESMRVAAAPMGDHANPATAASEAKAAAAQTEDAYGLESGTADTAPQISETAGSAAADAGRKLAEFVTPVLEHADPSSWKDMRAASTGEARSAAACADPDAPASAEADSPEMGPDQHTDPALAGHEDTDLRELPGAGEGLVWLLRQNGIHSLADLGRADTAELATRLELVGKLIDLDGWIAFARMRGDA